jgi:hypothetical protein
MPNRSRSDLGPLEEQLEHLRRGTFEKYVSDWTYIEDTGNHIFYHELEEVPIVVDLVASEDAGGKNAFAVTAGTAAGQAAVVKTDTTITVTSTLGTAVVGHEGIADYYFQVRAF